MRTKNYSVNQSRKLIIYLLLAHFCYDEITYDLKSFHSINNLMELTFQKEPFFHDMAQKEAFKENFLDKKPEAGTKGS